MRMSIHVVYLVHISVEFTFIAMNCFIITMNRTPIPLKLDYLIGVAIHDRLNLWIR